jgi:hypothetical protein
LKYFRLELFDVSKLQIPESQKIAWSVTRMLVISFITKTDKDQPCGDNGSLV